MSNYKIIEDLVLFYVKENYKNYLKENNITTIPDNQIESAVNKIYTERKSHLEGFLKKSLKQIMGNDYIGDTSVLNICREIFSDEELCINRIIKEVIIFQKNK